MQSHCCVFALKVPEDLLNHHWIFDAGDDLDVAAAVLADLDVGVENALQPLRPGHCRSVFDRCRAVRRICRTGLVALTALGRRHLCAMRTVRGEHTMKSSQVNPRLRHQRDESGDEVHRPEDDVRGAIAVRRFKLVAQLAIAQQRQPLFRHRGSSDVAA